jgi:transcriptional regulator with XRE-family HTH domain
MSIGEFYAQVGEKIAQVRKERGLTQKELADAVHFTRTAITNIENGKQKLHLHSLIEIAQVLGVPPMTFVPDRQDSFDSADMHVVVQVKSSLPEDAKRWLDNIIDW